MSELAQGVELGLERAREVIAEVAKEADQLHPEDICPEILARLTTVNIIPRRNLSER